MKLANSLFSENVFLPSLPARVVPPVPAALSPQVAPSSTESCFARQHNISDNNNQCFSGANGHIPSQLAAQRPGAIDNQSLVNTDPMKAKIFAISKALQSPLECKKSNSEMSGDSSPDFLFTKEQTPVDSMTTGWFTELPLGTGSCLCLSNSHRRVHVCKSSCALCLQRLPR